MRSRHRDCGPEISRGRLSKAVQFHEAAELIQEFADDEAEVGDAFVTLCVHAGIAAADAICCQELGRQARGDSHDEAVSLLRSVRAGGDELAAALNVLLSMKTRAGSGHEPINPAQRARARRRARQLVDAARNRVMS